LRAWLREIWDYRDVFYFLVLRDVKVRYKQTLLGALWVVIQPLMSMVLLTLIFGRLAGFEREGVPYAIFAYTALVPWLYFSTALSSSGNSMVSNSSLLTKIYFPRVAIPVSAVLAGLIDFAIASLLLVVLMIYYGTPFTTRLVLWPLLTLPLLLLALGSGCIVACLNVRYRDVKYALPFLIQMAMFATPIIYPLALVPASYRWVVAMNPLTGLIEAFRASALATRPVDISLLGVSIAETVLIVVFSVFYFRKTERVLADIV